MIPPTLLDAVYFKPWLLTAGAHAAMRMRIERAGEARKVEFAGASFDLPGMSIDRGVAIVPVKGVMGRGFSGMDAVDLILGSAVDSEMVAEDLLAADEASEVGAVLLDIDSPGGMVNGTPELGSAVEGMSKPVFAFSSGMMASAAYWLGSSASGGIFTTSSADVGSIGVYQLHLDFAALVAASGVNAELFKSGEFKAMGHPYFSLTDAQRAHMQESVDMLFGQFADWVTSHRPVIDDSTMQGQTFSGEHAVEAGLVDAIVGSRRQVLDIIREDVGIDNDFSRPAMTRRAVAPATTAAAQAAGAPPLFLTVNVDGKGAAKKAVTFERDASGAVIGMKSEDTE